MNTETKSRLAGLPDGYNGQRAMLATGNGYAPMIHPQPPSCQSPAASECYQQVVYHLAMAERWLDLASETQP